MFLCARGIDFTSFDYLSIGFGTALRVGYFFPFDFITQHGPLTVRVGRISARIVCYILLLSLHVKNDLQFVLRVVRLVVRWKSMLADPYSLYYLWQSEHPFIYPSGLPTRINVCILVLVNSLSFASNWVHPRFLVRFVMFIFLDFVSLSSVLWYQLRFLYKNDFRYLQLFSGGLMSNLRYLCLYIVVS